MVVESVTSDAYGGSLSNSMTPSTAVRTSASPNTPTKLAMVIMMVKDGHDECVCVCVCVCVYACV
jgi:hypothetical protein